MIWDDQIILKEIFDMIENSQKYIEKWSIWVVSPTIFNINEKHSTEKKI